MTYQPIVIEKDKLDFGQALVYLKSSRWLRRPGWPEGSFLWLSRSDDRKIRWRFFVSAPAKLDKPWTCTTEDLLAHDWQWVVLQPSDAFSES